MVKLFGVVEDRESRFTEKLRSSREMRNASRKNDGSMDSELLLSHFWMNALLEFHVALTGTFLQVLSRPFFLSSILWWSVDSRTSKYQQRVIETSTARHKPSQSKAIQTNNDVDDTTTTTSQFLLLRRRLLATRRQ